MARITVEDCVDKFESRFELVLVASKRARKLHSGENPTVDKDNDKPTVIALREIADETLPIDSLKDSLIQEYQTVSALEDEELSLEYNESQNVIKDEITEDENQSNEASDKEQFLNEVISSADEDDKVEAPKNDGHTDILDDNNSDN